MDTFKFLLKRGSTICATVNGSTVLMEAVVRNRPDFVDYLVANADKLGLDLQVRDKKGSNVLFYAASVGNPEIFHRLVEAGCPVESDVCHRTVLMQAALSAHSDMVKYLALTADSINLCVTQEDEDGRNALFYGVESARLDIVQYLVSLGLKCRKDKIGKTNLMQAARAGNLALTRYLLEHAQSLELDVTSVDSKGENALFYAVRSRRLSVVCAILEHGVDALQRNTNQMNAISLGLSLGQTGIVLALVESVQREIDSTATAIHSKDAKERTVLHHFVEMGDMEFLKKYAKLYRPKDDSDLNGCTLLMCACKQSSDTRQMELAKSSDIRQMELVKYLVEVIGVDVNAVDKRNRSALFYAVGSGNLTLTSYLLQRAKNLESDSNGLSLLMVAVVTGNQPTVSEILNSKFVTELMTKTDRLGRNEVHFCAMHDCAFILETLMTYETCNYDLADSDGMTPLMYACENGRYAVVSCLLRQGDARVDRKDNEGRNALHHCFTGTNPSLNCARLLVQRNIDVNLADVKGLTPLMLACQSCAKTHIHLIRFLIDHGADPILQDQEGKDAFDHCPFDSEYVKAMLRIKTEISSSEKKALQSFQPRLSEGIHLNSVLRGLLKEKVFTKTLNFEVMKQPHQDRTRKLIDILSSRGKSAFRAFCNVLKKEGEIEMSFQLKKEAYKKELEIFW